ncbi:MAG: AAA family ATPase [Vicinamibacterales bacterium]
MDLIELEQEQQYFDRAVEFRERSRHALGRAAGAGVHGGAAAGLKTQTDQMVRAFREPTEAPAFGRVLFDGDDPPLYVGYQAIWGESSDILVVSWQAPVASAYFEATVVDPRGLVARREYRCKKTRIEQWEDLVFADLLDRVDALERQRVAEPRLADSLLDSLLAGRTGEMQDIVRTIQAAQYELLRAPLDQLLIIQGGPGTGKTAVALHRVSWLLFNHAAELAPRDVLVIGPNPTFLRYIQRVLPSLGDGEIRQSALHALAPKVDVDRVESDEVVRLKGEIRMRELLRVALRNRVRPPAEDLTIGEAGRARTIAALEVLRLTEQLRRHSYAEGRERFREGLESLLEAQRVDPASYTQDIGRAVDRIWPSLTAPAFLRELFGSRERLTEAAADAFTAGDVTRLLRQPAGRISEERWSSADVPLLDYAAHLISGEQVRYRHVVVDEAQDLSPMELDMVRRRSTNGSMTVLGDIAQSTGPWARNDWDGVVEICRSNLPFAVHTLQYGYRVPRQLFEFAAQLLPHIAPGLEQATSVRDGQTEPKLQQVEPDAVASEVVAAAREYASRGLFVGLVCPESAWDEIVQALKSAGVAYSDARREGIGASINLVTPTTVKGLEFDAVVVVEPQLIVTSEEHGLRLLYVALTRSTQEATVVGSNELMPLPRPNPVETDAREAREQGDEDPTLQNPEQPSADVASLPRLVEAIAQDLAQQLSESVQPPFWAPVIARIEAILEESQRNRG